MERTLELAAQAAEWGVVTSLARELECRRGEPGGTGSAPIENAMELAARAKEWAVVGGLLRELEHRRRLRGGVGSGELRLVSDRTEKADGT